MKWQVHKHLMNKSSTQTKQYRWLMEMEPTLGHMLALDSLHSHDPNLGRSHHPPYILDSLQGLHWNGFFLRTPKRESQNSQVMSFEIFWAHNFFTWTLVEEFLLTFSCNPWQDISYAMLHASIEVNLTFISLVLVVKN